MPFRVDDWRDGVAVGTMQAEGLRESEVCGQSKIQAGVDVAYGERPFALGRVMWKICV